MRPKACQELAVIGATIVCLGSFWSARAEDHSTQGLPVLSVKADPHGQSQSLVNIRVPSIDGLEMDLWCYENGPWGKAVAARWEGRDLILTHKKDGPLIECSAACWAGVIYREPLARALAVALMIASDVMVAPLTASMPFSPCLATICLGVSFMAE